MSEFSDEDNVTLVNGQSFDDNSSAHRRLQEEELGNCGTINTISDVIWYTVVVLGFPGNIL